LIKRAAFIALLSLIGGRVASAQPASPIPAGVGRPTAAAVDPGPAALDAAARAPATLRWDAAPPERRGVQLPRLDREQVRRLAPIASAILPGAGQYILGENRFLIYAAVEAGFWVTRMNDQSDRRRQERAFRDLARDVARSPFSPNRSEGDWAYYEEMRSFAESGAFSLSNATLVPETDMATFNGFIWQAAQAHNPDRESALAEYRARAIPREMQWSWRDAQLQWDRFKRATEARNNAAARARLDLIVIGANHVISMVDAFTTIRLQVRPAAGGGFQLTGTLPRR